MVILIKDIKKRSLSEKIKNIIYNTETLTAEGIVETRPMMWRLNKKWVNNVTAQIIKLIKEKT